MIRRTVIARAAASAILAGALLVGTSGCVFLANQATLNRYDPSDGVSTTIGTLDVRNAIAIANADGTTFNLMITLINRSNDIATVTLQYQSDGVKTTTTKSVRSNSTAQYGNTPEQSQILISNPGVAVGSLFPVYIQSGTDPGSQILVPILDGSLPQYSTLVPSAAPTAVPVPAVTETPTPTPTPTPAG